MTPHFTQAATRRCLERQGYRLVRGATVRAAAGSVVVATRRGEIAVSFAASARAAQALAQASGGPGDPYGYAAVGNAVVQWPAGADAQARAVARCLR